MSRQARVVAVDVPHHITHRGNNRQDVFLTDDDRRFYLAILREKSQLFGLSILGFCLMTNHVHVVGVPGEMGSTPFKGLRGGLQTLLRGGDLGKPPRVAFFS